MTTLETGVHSGILDADYHRLPSLSSSGARLILDSPARFKYAMQHRKDAPHFDMGRYVHALVLEPHRAADSVVILDYDSYRTKAAQQARDDAYANDVTPMLYQDAKLAKTMADAVTQHPVAAQLLNEGEPELSLAWTDEQTGIPLRARFDWLRRSDNTIVDLKTTAGSAAPAQFANTAAKYKYFLQEAWYREGMRATGLADDCDFIYITVEKQPPHLVSVTRLHQDAIQLGNTLMRQAITTYAQCIETNTWPGYPDTITNIDLPAWAYWNNDDEPEIQIP